MTKQRDPSPPDYEVVVQPRLTFSTVIAESYRLYGQRLLPIALLFGVISLFISLLGLTGFTNLGGAELFVAFLAQIVLPVIFGSVAVATSSLMYAAEESGERLELREALDELRTVARDVFTAAVIASMLALWAIILLGQIGLALMPLFFGPPMLIHAISLEKLSMREGRARAREVVKGQTGRAVGFLFVIALGIGLLGGSLLRVTLSIADTGGNDAFLVVVFSLMQIIVSAFTLPFLAAAEHVVFTRMREMNAAAE